MSKSTRRYGNITLHAHTSIEAHPTPPPYIVSQWIHLDNVALEKYGVKYDSLSSGQKFAVHDAIKDRKRAKQVKDDLKEMELDCI